MDEIFSKRPYLVVRMPSAREFARKKRNRNERPGSRNLLMRNLLTAFAAIAITKCAGKFFWVHCKLFQQLAGKFSSIASLQKLVCARISSYVRYRALGRQDFSAKIAFPFRRSQQFALPRSREAMRTESPQFCCFLSLSTAARLFASKSI